MMKEIQNVRLFARRENGGEDLDGLSAFTIAPAAVPPGFVAKVMRGLPAQSGSARGGVRLTSWKWAAALLIFSAAMGYGFSIAEETADSVASLTSAPADSESSILSSF
jgi:hypothetical protein